MPADLTGRGRGWALGLLTIGAFARAARLSPKALRLYDELGLLPPAAVDAESGYRFYAPAQLDRARLIAWLRRLGMPLARIRQVCGLAPAAAAAGGRRLLGAGRGRDRGAGDARHLPRRSPVRKGHVTMTTAP